MTKKPAKAVWKRYPHSAVDELFIGGLTVASVEQLSSGVEWVVYITHGVDSRPYGERLWCWRPVQARVSGRRIMSSCRATNANPALYMRDRGAL